MVSVDKCRGYGVKQGRILFPILFTIVIDWVMKKSTNKPRDILRKMSTRLEDLNYITFADVICLVAQTEFDMGEKITYSNCTDQVGLI